MKEAVQQFKNGRKRRANRASNPKRSDFLVPKAIARQPHIAVKKINKAKYMVVIYETATPQVNP